MLTEVPLPPPQHLEHGSNECADGVVNAAPRNVHDEFEADDYVRNLHATLARRRLEEVRTV